MKRILTEASGSLVTNWLIRAIKESGNYAVASDITKHSVGQFLADDFALVPPCGAADLWQKLEQVLVEKHIDLVIPSLDETLVLWAEHKDELEKEYGVKVIISNAETIRTFADKYRTFLFFSAHGIPTPRTSLAKEFPLIKPRQGRGGRGVRVTNDPNVDMTEMISQELLIGQEYTVDCLVDGEGKPVYIIPRKRLNVKEGKSVNGEVVDDPEITRWVEQICASIRFLGPVNMQCFKTEDGVKFTEINPRIAGGMALGLAASENWITLLVDYILPRKTVVPKPIRYGLRMYRYYEEIFV